MRKSVKVYMVQDLILLTVLGLFLEGLTQKFVPVVLGGAPSITFALLVVFLAVTRWGLWGLLVAPVIALSTWLGGSLASLKYVAHAYDWRLYLSEVAGLLTIGVNVLFFRKHKTNKVVGTTWKLLLIMLLDYALYCFIQIGVYRLITTGSPFEVGSIGEYVTQITSGEFDASGNWVETTNYNVFVNYCMNTERGFVYNLFGFGVCIVGVFILRSQGIVNNAVDKLVDDKKMAEAEAKYVNNLGNGESGISKVLAEESENSTINDDDSKVEDEK